MENQRTSAGKQRLIREIKQAVKDMKLIKSGKKKGRDAHDFLKSLES